MCGGGKTPKPVTVDPEADAERVAAEAAVAANSQAVARRRSRRLSSLSSPQSVTAGAETGTALGYGKTVLGG